MQETAIKEQSESNRLCIASYNIHSSVGMDRKRKPSRIAEVIEQIGCAIIALQEVDNQPGDHDESMQLQYFAKRLGMTAVPGLRMIRKTGEYGNAVLTRFPILDVRHHLLDYPRCEPRGAIDVHLDVHGRKVRVIAAHLGLRRAERRFQWTQILKEVAEECSVPTFVLGDMNEWFRGSATLKQAHRLFGAPPAPPAFPSFWPVLALTRIWIRPVQTLVSMDVHRTELSKVASDHLPVKATVDLGRGDR